MLSLGGGELILIAVLAIVLIGPDKLPEAARWLGKTWGGLRRTMDDLSGEFRRELHQVDDEVREATRLADVSESAKSEPENEADPGEVTADADLSEFLGDVTASDSREDDPTR